MDHYSVASFPGSPSHKQKFGEKQGWAWEQGYYSGFCKLITTDP